MKVILAGSISSLMPLCDSFLSKGWQVTIIHENRDDCERLAGRTKALIVCGDPSSPEVLEDAGIRDADAVLAATQVDSVNLAICATAATEYGIGKALALVNTPGNVEVFERLGIRSFSANAALASLIQQMADLEEITGIGALADGRIQITELRVHAGWPCVGVPLQALRMPKGSLMAAILRAEEVVIPSGATSLQAGDRAILISTSEAYGSALASLSGADTGGS